MRIFHILDKLTLGGPTRALAALAKHSARQGDFQHAVATLAPADPGAFELAEAAGLRVAGPMSGDEMDRRIAEADVVQFHFWNSPRLHEMLDSEWPAARVICWCHIAGDGPAQVLTPAVVAFPDAMVATAAGTAELPVFRQAPTAVRTEIIPASADFERVEGVERRTGSRFTVGYMGVVDFVKMHPDFAAMHAAIELRDLRIVVCGTGADLPHLARQATRLACGNRFEFRGHIESVGKALAEFDVFGYPLHPQTYATAELSLQEAMFSGVPPVVLDRGAPARIVQHERTGLVVSGPEGYSRAIERLYREPGLRSALGAAAARFARAEFGADKMARSFNRLYEELMAQPKRVRHAGATGVPRLGAAKTGPSGACLTSGAARFIESLGAFAAPFAASFRAETGLPSAPEVNMAESLIAASSPLLSNGGVGGILHYRIHYPSDPHLSFWAGLVFENQGRPALAAMEYRRAISLGLDPLRAGPRLAAVMARATRDQAPC